MWCVLTRVGILERTCCLTVIFVSAYFITSVLITLQLIYYYLGISRTIEVLFGDAFFRGKLALNVSFHFNQGTLTEREGSVQVTSLH
jgi:hypothetical protein